MFYNFFLFLLFFFSEKSRTQYSKLSFYWSS